MVQWLAAAPTPKAWGLVLVKGRRLGCGDSPSPMPMGPSWPLNFFPEPMCTSWRTLSTFTTFLNELSLLYLKKQQDAKNYKENLEGPAAGAQGLSADP